MPDDREPADLIENLRRPPRADSARTSRRRRRRPSATCRATVVEPALKLIDTFDTLSRGWGLGLLGGTILCWAMALGQFIQLLDKPTSDAKLADGQPPPANIPLITILSMVPFWMASDITQTSSLCDQLVDTINDAGIRYREPCYTRIAWLESRLTQLNRGQGLGFKIAEHHGGFSGRWTFDGARDALRAQ